MEPGLRGATSIDPEDRAAMQSRGPSSPLNSPGGGASMKPPTAVAPAVYDSLAVSRTPSDYVMGAALRDPTSIAKELCFGRFNSHPFSTWVLAA